MKKTVLFAVLLAVLALTGCGREFELDESMKDSLTKSIEEQTFEIVDIEGMAYFYVDADYVQLIGIDGNPISYEEGKNHNLFTHDLEFLNDSNGYRYIIEDSETAVKYLHSALMNGYTGIMESNYLYESDVDLIINEDGLPKID